MEDLKVAGLAPLAYDENLGEIVERRIAGARHRESKDG